MACLVILAVGYFYWQEFKNPPIDSNLLNLSVNPYCLAIALFLSLLSYLIEAVIWRVIIKKQLGRKGIKFREIITILFASGLFRYLPGRIWTLTTQSLWLKKYGITKSLVLYINLVCMAGLIIFSLYLGLLYVALYTSGLSVAMVVLLFVALASANVLYNRYSKRLINKIFTRAGKITKTEIQQINVSHDLLIIIQFIYTCSWVLTGLATYFLAKGLGLQIVLADTIPIVASMSLSWLAGSLAVFAPAGLGVREGMMLLMLKPVLVTQTALLLPIVSRVMLLLSEVLLGVAALCLGARSNVFMLKKNEGR
jgi:uncharacterized membrane protein YbhN (UPF0104 family)